MDLELRHFRCFVAVVDSGSVTAAAARLHLTQPALSRTLRQLEESLGVLLVERTTRTLRPTAEGRVFYEKAVTVLAAVDEATDVARLRRWPLRLGYAWAAAGRHTSTILTGWRAAQPDVPLTVRRVDDRTAGLARGVVDVALVRVRLDDPSLHVEVLFEEGRCAALPAEHPLARRDAVALAELADETVAINVTSGSTTLELWPAGHRPAATVDVTNTDEWLTLIGAGQAVGVTTTSISFLCRYPGVAYVPLPDAPRVPVYLAWRHDNRHPYLADFVALAHRTVRSGS